MNEANFSRHRNAFATAIEGMVAWLAYGAVEFVLCCVWPVVESPDNVFSPWGWRLVGILFGVYAAAGLVLGGIAGAALPRGSGRRQHVLAGTLTLVVGMLAHLVSEMPLARSEYIALGIGLGVAAILGRAIFSEDWTRRWGFLASPWTVSLVLLAAPYISRELLQKQSAVVKLAASVMGAVVLIAASRLMCRRMPGEVSWARRLAAALAVIGVSAAVVAALSQRGFEMPARAASPRADRPNVVLLVMDTVRTGNMSLYGYERETTPFLKALARGATVYQRLIASSDFTLPTHASIFTGLYTSWHGAHPAPPHYPWGRPLDDKTPTLAAALAEKGYCTAAFVANYEYLSRTYALDRGFQIYRARTPVFLSDQGKPFFLRQGVRSLLAKIGTGSDFDMRCQRAEEINQEAFRFLDAAAKRQPFFLFVNYMDAHSPYVVPAPFDRQFPGRDFHYTEESFRRWQKQVLSGRRRVTEAERRHLISQYDGGIAYLDSEIERLVGHLKKLGAYENTMLIVTSDHGEALGDKNLLEHQINSLYEDIVHVPLLIKYPKHSSPKSDSMLVSQVDIMPTVLDVVGYPVPRVMQGQSLLKPIAPGRTVYSEAFAKMGHDKLDKRFGGEKRAAFSGSMKLITWTKGATELYDLAKDPNENANLYDPEQKASMALETQLTQWAKSAPARQPQASRKEAAPNLQHLKALGYAQ